MDVYAPLAHRLGMQKMKWELEDTSLRYLAPKEYTEITNYLQAHREKDEAFMQSIQFKITDRLNAMGIQNTTYGRIKHHFETKPACVERAIRSAITAAWQKEGILWQTTLFHQRPTNGEFLTVLADLLREEAAGQME